jgi:hypothetical protein
MFAPLIGTCGQTDKIISLSLLMTSKFFLDTSKIQLRIRKNIFFFLDFLGLIYEVKDWPASLPHFTD